MNNPKRESSLKSYSPLEIEQKWQKKWQELDAFNTALIDVIVRFQRLIGKNVLCLPGTDHASIAQR